MTDAKQPRLRILLLCDDNRGHANTVLDHIQSFTRYSRHDVRVYNPRGIWRSRFLDLDEFDVVIVHYSLIIISDGYLSPSFRAKIQNYRGLKVLFIQDDYRWIEQMCAMIKELGIQIFYTLMPQSEVPKVWTDRLPNVKILTTLAGYVPEDLKTAPAPPTESRTVDIGYRGRSIFYWLGRFSQEKRWIGMGVKERAPAYGLRVDIGWAEEDRIYGDRWVEFVRSCKATLGTESGASITDFDGSIEQRTKQYLADHPTATFEEVHEKILAPYEGNVRLFVISPRIFEAVALRTALILFPGDYSGVIKPHVHYIPLERDFSNMDEVVARLRDPEGLQAMIERAHADVIASGTYDYRAFIEGFDAVVSAHVSTRRIGPAWRYALARNERPIVAPINQFVHTIRGTRMFNRVRRTLAAMLAAREIARNPSLRALLARWLRDGRPGRAMRLGAVIEELLRLGVAGRAAVGGHDTGEPFHVTAHYDPAARRLLLVSKPGLNGEPQRNGHPDPLDAQLAEAMHDGDLQAIHWNHSALGTHVPIPITRSQALTVPLGAHGAHRFDILGRLARWYPREAARAMAPLLHHPIYPYEESAS